MKATILILMKTKKDNLVAKLKKGVVLSPTESLLLTFLSSLSELLRSTNEFAFTGKVTKGLSKCINLVLSKSDEPAAEMVKAIKSALAVSFSHTWLSYAISKLKSRFADASVAKVLGPAAIAKHRGTLSVPVDEVPERQLERTVELATLLVQGSKYDWGRVASVGGKSCLEFSAAEGGKREALSEDLNEVFRRSTQVNGSTCNPTIVVSSDNGSRTVLDCPPFEEIALKSFSSDWNRKLVKAVSVPGPLKARIITKETAANYFLEPVRRGIWKNLARREIFMIDGPPKVEEIPERLPGDHYVSGDYSAATDGFHPEVSEAILGVIADHVCDDLKKSELLRFDLTDAEIENIRVCIKTSMTGKTIQYPDGSEIEQRRGQLMGNLLSFPVLCIYNYAVWHIARERAYGVRLPIQSDVRINGDDILFSSTLREYRVWKRMCDKMGMELNDLKTQLSQKACSLNSQLFIERDDKLVKVFAHRVFDRTLDRDEARRLNEVERKLCGEFAPGSFLFRREAVILPSPVEKARCFVTDGWKILWETMRGPMVRS